MDGNYLVDFKKLSLTKPLTALWVGEFGRVSLITTTTMQSLAVRVRFGENSIAAIKRCQSGATFDIIAINTGEDNGLQTVKCLYDMGVCNDKGVRTKLIGFADPQRENIPALLNAGLDYCLQIPLVLDNLSDVLREIAGDI